MKQLDEQDVAYVEATIDAMVQLKKGRQDVMSDAHNSITVVLRDVATVAGHGAAVELLHGIANGFIGFEDYFKTLNEAYKMTIDMKRSLGKLETYRDKT